LENEGDMKKILLATLKIEELSNRKTGLSDFFSSMKFVHGAIFLVFLILLPVNGWAQPAASSNYNRQTGTLGTTYSWIDCSPGSNIVSGDDVQASITWPFGFAFYDNIYTTANSLSVCTNGFIRLDGSANTNYSAASSYDLNATSTELGQIIAMAVYDGKVENNGGWVRSLVTGSSPNRIFTIEYNNLEIDYNDNKYTNVQVSFYEASYKVVLKLGPDNINKNGVDMGIHSGVVNYFNKWQEVRSGTNSTWIEYTPAAPPNPPSPPAANWNYGFGSGNLGTTYSWIDCSSGNFVVSGDDAQAQINWPFNFNFYDNTYTTSNTLSVGTNGFIRLNGVASTDYSAASDYDLTSSATNLGQIIAVAVYDGNVSAGSWVRSLVTGTAPNRVFTIEYNNHEIDYNDGLYANAQVSFYESTNIIVLKLGSDNINKSGVDMGLHSGVNTYFNKWQEVLSGTNNTWIEYIPPYVEVDATIGSLSASYFTMKSAFDKINDGTHRGKITIKINHSTTEPSAAVLNGSGTGSANYSSVNIYPTETGLSISGDLPTPLIDLNGADNVTIDGRVNATGTTKDLTIINTSTSSTAGTSTVRFINDASNNTIKYCTIKGSELSATSGILFFSTTSFSTGSDNNTISYNNITSSALSNRPVNAIYSYGTPGKNNSNNNISANNIYDFLNPGEASNGILLSENTTIWTIDGNSFYETASFIPTSSVSYHAIQINNPSGYGFIVTNNNIGGSTAICGGTAWTKTNATNNIFTAIHLNVSSTTASSLQSNTIQNVNWSNSGSADWVGIQIVGGMVDVGTISGNTIGATTGTNSIRVTGGLNGQSIYGIKLSGTGILNCNNNLIGSLTGIAASGLATHLYGIYLSGSAVTTIEDNTIGSTTTGSSIHASSESTSNAQNVYGIYSLSTGSTTIHHNTISNLKNNSSNTATATAGLINGIYISSGTNTVSENTIRDISISNANTSLTTPSAVGMFFSTGTGIQSIGDNLIYNVSNTYSSFSGSVVGMYFTNSVGAGVGNVNANFIHSLSVAGASAGAKLYGIYENTDEISYSNNIISLGGNTSTTIYGVYDVGSSGKSVDFLFNTIYLSGTNSGTEPSFALWYNTNSNTRDLRNNILYNSRNGGAGSHYAIYYNATGGTFTADYNDYFVNGTGGILGYYGGGQSTLALLQTATAQDANSLYTNPLFVTAGGSNSSDYATIASLTGVSGTGITLDYDGITRINPPKMGALEISFTFIWQGNTSTDFATATNWESVTIPPNGANIEFAASPANDCYLDQARTLKNITNTSTKKFNVNGKPFTLTGNIVSATSNQIDAATASSVVIFAGTSAQIIPDGVFAGNIIDALTLNNSHGLTQNGNLTLTTSFTLTSGAYSIGTNTLTIQWCCF
jgi:hypothetical protein